MKKLLWAIALIALALTMCCFVSCGEETVEVTPLEAPTNVRYDGVMVTWNAVANADSYSIQINDGQSWTVRTNQYSYAATDETFTVKISANSTKEEYSTSPETVTEFKPLGYISEVRVSEDGTISWDPVNMATAYEIRVNGTVLGELAYVTEFKGLPVGANSVQVRAAIDGDTSYYASWSPAKNVTILSYVSTDDIKYTEGFVTWKYVSGAQKYKVTINGVVVAEGTNETKIAYDAQKSDFEVTVQALGDRITTFDGNVSEIKKFIFLDPVTDVRVEDGMLKWDPVEKADGYLIRLNGRQHAETLRENVYNNLSTGVSTKVEIMPISNDGTYFSDWSVEKNILLLQAPIIRWNDYGVDSNEANRNVYWDGIAGAAGYAVRVTLPSGEVKVNTYGETERAYADNYSSVGTYKIEVKSLAPVGVEGTYDSGYSVPITVKRLEAPKPVTQNFIVSDAEHLTEGFTVTFKEVDGATQYRLYKDGVQHLNSTATQFTVKDLVSDSTLGEQMFNFQIQAVGIVNSTTGNIVVTLDSLSSESLSFSIKVLATPTNPTISGYTYSYTNVNNAFGYIVDAGGHGYTAGETTFDLSPLEAGAYDIRVCAKGNGSDVLASNYSAPISVFRLEAPSNVRIGTTDVSEGILTYDSVLYATGYTIVFNNDGNAIPANTISNVNQYISEQGTTVYMQSTANYFNEDNTVYYMTSRPGKTTNFIKLASPTFGTNPFTGSVLSWNLPSNVIQSVYTPTYIVYDDRGIEYTGGIKNGTSIDLSNLEGGKTYTFHVKAIGDGVQYINSVTLGEEGAEGIPGVTIYKLPTPEVRCENGSYVWTMVPSATSYAVYVDGELKQTYASGQTVYSYAPGFEEIGTYNVKIYAIGDGIYSMDSKPAEIEQETKQLITPDFTLSYTHDSYNLDGKIVVTVTQPSPYATGYCYTIAGATYTSSELTFAHNPGSVGTFEARIYALGGGFDENGVYYIDSQSQGGNARYSITLFGSPNPTSFRNHGDGSFSWATVTGASRYEVSISKNGGAFETDTTTSANVVVTDYRELSSITIRVRVLGDGINSVTSDYVERTWYL